MVIHSNPLCLGVLTAAVASLGNLVVSHTANQATAYELGAIDAVALAATRFPGSVSLQSYSSAFFLKMTTEGLWAPEVTLAHAW